MLVDERIIRRRIQRDLRRVHLTELKHLLGYFQAHDEGGRGTQQEQQHHPGKRTTGEETMVLRMRVSSVAAVVVATMYRIE